MPIETTYHEAENLRYHVLTESFTGSELITEVQRTYEAPGFVLHANAVWDVSAADVSTITSDELRALASFIQSVWRGTSDLRAALVTGSDLNFGLARMYEQLQGVYSEEGIRVFRELEPAWKWVCGSD